MKRLWILLILICLLASPVGAQDDDEWEEFVSDDERITLNYPADWYVESFFATAPNPVLIIANSEEAVERDEFLSGDIALILTFVPVEELDEMEIDLPEDYDLLDLLSAIIEQSEESDGAADFEEPEVVELEISEDEILEAARVPFTSDIYDGVMIVMVQEDTLIMALMAAYPGEFTEEIEIVNTAIFTSIQYTPEVEVDATAEPDATEESEE